MGYRKFLNSHGLRLKYDERKRRSTSSKSYVDDNGKFAYIYVQHTHHLNVFQIVVDGEGFHLDYFKREAQVLRERLEEFGFNVFVYC